MIIINLSKPSRFRHSYCVYRRWGTESARMTGVGLLVLEVAGGLGRAVGLPSVPILSGLSRTQIKSSVADLGYSAFDPWIWDP